MFFNEITLLWIEKKNRLSQNFMKIYYWLFITRPSSLSLAIKVLTQYS